MTRKHFQQLADELKSAYPVGNNPLAIITWRECVEAVARTCKAGNSNFDRARFLKACGYE
jgi:hypothetical protein